MIDGRLEQLPVRLQTVIEAEAKRCSTLQDQPGDDTELLMARGRRQAWMAIHRFLTEVEDALERYE